MIAVIILADLVEKSERGINALGALRMVVSQGLELGVEFRR